MKKQFIQLKNGTRVHLLPFSGTKTTAVLVLFRVGSRYEYADINGASHFIEHLMFKGTKKRPNTLAISKSLDAIGADYNAYTGKNITGYYIRAGSTHQKLAVDILHDMLFHSTYKPEEMKRERRVIIEEINMYKDNPIMHVEDLLEQAMFEGNTLGWEIAGSSETMLKMTRKQVIDFRDAHYTPERMVIAVAGKVDPQIKGWLESTFGKVAVGKKNSDGYKDFGAFEETKKPRVKIQYKETEQVQIALGFPSYGVDDDRNPAVELLATILGGTMSSRLFVSVRERRGLAYMVRASNSKYEDIGNFMIQSGLDKSRVDLAMKVIFKELKDIKKNGPSAEELKLAKEYRHGKLVIALENSSSQAEFYARQELFLGKTNTPETVSKKYANVTKAQIKKVANDILNVNKLSIAAIGPYKTEASLLKHFPLK